MRDGRLCKAENDGSTAVIGGLRKVTPEESKIWRYWSGQVEDNSGSGSEDSWEVFYEGYDDSDEGFEDYGQYDKWGRDFGMDDDNFVPEIQAVGGAFDTCDVYVLR